MLLFCTMVATHITSLMNLLKTYWPMPFVFGATREHGTHVPPVPSIEHWKRDQYRPFSGGNFRKSVPTRMRYASVRCLEVFEKPLERCSEVLAARSAPPSTTDIGRNVLWTSQLTVPRELGRNFLAGIQWDFGWMLGAYLSCKMPWRTIR